MSVSNLIIKGHKTLYVDVDDTIAMGNLSDYPEDNRTMVPYVNGEVAVVPNYKNINLMVYFHKLGYIIVAWSKTGGDWAHAVFNALGLEKYPVVYLTKPTFYLDDQDVNQWIGPRRWRDCK